MLKSRSPTGAATARDERDSDDVIRFPKKGSLPRGRPVNPFATLISRMANPDYAAAFLARLIAKELGGTITAAVVPAIILLTWPRYEWPDRVVWFHDWRFGTAGSLRSWPNQERVLRLLHKGRA